MHFTNQSLSTAVSSHAIDIGTKEFTKEIKDNITSLDGWNAPISFDPRDKNISEISNEYAYIKFEIGGRNNQTDEEIG